MALKFKYPSKDQVPAEHESLYVERDGAFVLDAEGVADKSKLDEFRVNNVALQKQLADLNQRFEGIDPAQVKALMDAKLKLEEAKLLKDGEFEKLLDSRTRAVKADLEKQIAGLSGERDSLTAQLMEVRINQGVAAAATKRGLRPTAIPDAVARARTVFRLVNGVATAFEADGATARYGRDGVSPLTLDEWADGLMTDAPHLFESSAGGGAAGNNSGGVGNSGKNPFKRGAEWNLTEQMRMHKTDSKLAARLKAAA